MVLFHAIKDVSFKIPDSLVMPQFSVDVFDSVYSEKTNIFTLTFESSLGDC